MVRLARSSPGGTFLNLACGSATLMVERLALGFRDRVIGVDIREEALDCARANLGAAGQEGNADLLLADARSVPLPAASVDAIATDLPYGMLTGADTDLGGLYHAIMAEAARLARPSAPLVVITARKRELETALRRLESRWTLERVVPISVPFRSGYIKPSIFALRRRSRC